MNVTPLLGTPDRARARRFLASQGLRFEEPLDDLVGAFAPGGDLAGVGARAGAVLKMIALVPAERDGSLLGTIVTALVGRALTAGVEGLFVFTRPEHAPSFEMLNFELLAASGPAALLEYGGGFGRWLASARAALGKPPPLPGRSGAVVVNCNPFTLGHRYLVASAAARVERLVVLLVEEDRSAFPFEVRLRLVRRGTADLPNVRVLATGPYAVSAVTFPAYFLRAGERAAELQGELDAALFARRIAPGLGLWARYVGDEPFDPTTRAYNAVLRRVLPPGGVELVEEHRLAAAGQPISASRVRELLARGPPDRATLAALVPPTTLEYLLSGEARPVLERLREVEGRR